MEAAVQVTDTPELRKARGAFFTPEPIADYLADWAVEDDPAATVLDPTCGEAVFLLAAARRLARVGAGQQELATQVLGVDLHQNSFRRSAQLLEAEGLAGTFLVDDFFGLETPERLGAKLPQVDAVIGNPPFVRYQNHTGLERKRAQAAALQRGSAFGACLFMGRSRRPLLWIPEARGPSSNGAPRRASDDRLRGGSSLVAQAPL